MENTLTNDSLEQLLRQDPAVHIAQVEGDGYHYQLLIVSDYFLGKTKVARQQWVYGKLKEHIASGRLHALTMKTLTKKEWEETNG
jgi:acid stress-induced BolA-like protein IbaG/YrbA